MTLLDEHKEQFILFIEAGFIAVNQSDESSATNLFKAAALLNQESPLPKVGMGYLHLCKLELKQATEMFQEVVTQDPENEMAKAFLGITLSFNPEDNTEGAKILSETATESEDPEVKKLADMALSFSDSFLKQKPSPADVQKKDQ